MKNEKRSPWMWIPSLYFAQALPYVAVMTISVIMYKRLGISNTDITLYTSWLYLPWVIKPLWSPFVDLFKTKRWWIVTMQLLIGAGLAGVAFTIPMPGFFQWSLALFWLVGFSSATHDIAADGFYMLALNVRDQSLFVGIRSTFYRIATIMGQGLLIVVAGLIESSTGMEPVIFSVSADPQHSQLMVKPASMQSPTSQTETTFIVSASSLQLSTQLIPADSAKQIKKYAREQNEKNGFVLPEDEARKEGKFSLWWKKHVSQPLGNTLSELFNDKYKKKETGKEEGNIGLIAIQLSQAPAAGEKIVLNSSYDNGSKSISLAGGDRIEFTPDNWNKPAYLTVQLDAKLKEQATTSFKGTSGNISFAWSVTFFVLAGLFLAFTLYHKYVLPRPAADMSVSQGAATPSNIFKEFLATFATFFRKKGAVTAILFMLLYRFPEAQLVKLINLFLIDPLEKGGLGLTTSEMGFVYGTIGIIGLTLGGIIGGICAAKGGLRKWLWPMAWSISLTCLTFVYLGFAQPDSLLIINICVFIEQFGYGFGFTAYMLYLIYFSDGEHKTAHYAICTAFMALGMMLPGMTAGWLQEHIGYENFFIWVMICCVATIAVCAFIKIDPAYGRKEEAHEQE